MERTTLIIRELSRFVYTIRDELRLSRFTKKPAIRDLAIPKRNNSIVVCNMLVTRKQVFLH